MYYYELNGTTYRIVLTAGVAWWDTSRDCLERYNPDTGEWLPSDLNVNHVRVYGTPIQEPQGA